MMAYKATVSTSKFIRVLEGETIAHLAKEIIEFAVDVEAIYNGVSYIKINEKELNEKYVRVKESFKEELFQSMSTILEQKILNEK